MIPTFVNEQLRKYRRLHYSGHVLALVDGLQYQQQTGNRLAPEDDTAVSLFAGAKDIALAHAGPWLIDPKQARDRVANLEELEQFCPGVIWLISSERLEMQAEKLRTHLDVRLPNGRSALLRFWDPRVLHTLNEIYQGRDRRQLFKSVYEWHYLNEGQRQFINDHVSNNRAGMGGAAGGR